ncbi:MAG: hypothetical protein AB7F22_34520 [Reyranella sp.]|uniref:hypothetical protein n=1 Tax=Reyranella sp. TaxID=1929291 RepID=UPI003D12B739
MTTQGRTLQEPTEIQVWDPFVRVAHWTIAIGFFIAYLAEDDLLTIHVWAGYVVGTLMLMRVVWGWCMLQMVCDARNGHR